MGGVSPRCREQKNTGLPCKSYSGKTKLVLRERSSSGRFCFCLPSSSYRVWRFLCLFAIDAILPFSGVTLFHWRGVSLESINKPIILSCYFLFECSVESPPAGDLRFVRDRQKACACTRLRGSRKPSAKSVVDRAETPRDSLLKPFTCVPEQLCMPRAGHFYLWRY